MVRCKTCVICSLLISACGTLPDGRGYGQDVTPWPGWAKLAAAARTAALDTRTWVPLAGAAVVVVADADDDVSEWAVEHAPVFGTPQRAGEWSDRLRDVTRASAVLSLLATPGGETASDVFGARFKSLAVQSVAVATNAHVTNGIKRTVGRERPDAGNERSFPSGHSSEAFVQVAFARRHLDYVDTAPAARDALRTGVDLVAAGTAWARVEAGVHYPTDVLAGAALGNFVGAFFYHAFYANPNLDLTLRPEPAASSGFALQAQLRF